MSVETDEPRVGHPRRVFHPRFWVCFLSVAIQIQILVAALAAAIGAYHGWVIAGQMFAAMGVVGLIGAGVNAVLTWRDSAPAVGPRGIECVGPVRRRRVFAAWPDVHTAGVHVSLGTAHLKLGADGVPGPLWVPLYLADRHGFADAVREYAGNDHPVTRALDEWDALGAGE